MRLIDTDALDERLKKHAEGTSFIYKAGIDTARMFMAEAPTVGEWVSMKDRLPKDGQDILAYLNDGEETRIAPCNYSNGVWFDCVMNCVVVLQDVTHWMPLPEPPKEET